MSDERTTWHVGTLLDARLSTIRDRLELLPTEARGAFCRDAEHELDVDLTELPLGPRFGTVIDLVESALKLDRRLDTLVDEEHARRAALERTLGEIHRLPTIADGAA